MSIDAVFNGDYESAIIFSENIYMKKSAFWRVIQDLSYAIIALITLINAVFHEL
jgi:hypothetical protein